MAYVYESYGELLELDLKHTVYENNTLAITADIASGPEKGMPFGNITVNLNEPLEKDQAFVDVNNLEGIDSWLVTNGLAAWTGVSKQSGFVIYPLMKFNLSELPEIAM